MIWQILLLTLSLSRLCHSALVKCNGEVLKLQLCNIQDEEYNEALPHISTGPEGGLSLDLEPADKEPKNQNWLF